MKTRNKMLDLLMAVIGILLVFSAIVIFSERENIDLIKVLKDIGARRIIVAFLILLAAEVVKALRLNVFLKAAGVKATIYHSVIARLVGNFFSIVTPMSAGGTPARAIALIGLARGGAGPIAAATLLESFFDAMFMSIVSLIIAFLYIDKAWPVMIVSLYTFILWLLGLIYIVRKEEPEFLKRERTGTIGSFLKVARYHYEAFRKAVRIVNVRKIIIVTTILTVLSYLVSALAVASLLLAPTLVMLYKELVASKLASFYKCFVAAMFVQVLLALPIPGGAFGVEYVLLGVMPKESAMSWRLISYLYMIVPGGVLLTMSPAVKGKVVRQARENIYEYRYTVS